MAPPILFTALTDLEVSSMTASWPCPAGNVLPLDPSKPSTHLLLAAGSIAVAGLGAVDNTTPPLMVRGIPGIRVAVSN